MIEYSELERILEKLTVTELEQVKNNLLELSKENHAINKLDDYEHIIKKKYEFLKNIIGKEFINEYTDFYINLGIFKYGTYGLEELINRLITDKKNGIKKGIRLLNFNGLQNKIIHWGISKGLNDPKSQFLKVVEEFGEIQRATGSDELMDAIGDTLITLIILNGILQREIYEIPRGIYENQGEMYENQRIDISDIKEEDLHKYVQEKGGVSIAGDFRKVINTDVIVELSRLAEYINKMTEDNNKKYYVKKAYLHILEIVRYVFYLAEFEGVDFIKSLEFAYNNINK